jgi:uncharacterized membrane protein YgcG
MFRFAMISLLLTLSPSVLAQSGYCTEQQSSYETCLSNAGDLTPDSPAENSTACDQCYVNNNYPYTSNPQSSCNDVTSLICAIYSNCYGLCNPEQSACEQESKDFFLCILEASLALDNCKVQCEGGNGGGNTTGSGGGITTGSGGGNTTGTGGGSNNGGGSTVETQLILSRSFASLRISCNHKSRF